MLNLCSINTIEPHGFMEKRVNFIKKVKRISKNNDIIEL